MAETGSPIERRRLPALGALRAFEAAARHLSFRKAADELAVTPTAISHQIRQLELWLGLKLFVRSVRSVALTDAGARLLPPVRDGFDSFGRGIEALRPDGARRTVTLSATMLLTARRLLPALGTLHAAHPDLDLRLHASDSIVDIAGGMADVAVRYAPGPFPGLVAIPLFKERFGVLCSPRLGVTRPEDLRGVPLLHIEWKRTSDVPDWRAWAERSGLSGLALDTGPRFTEEGYALQAAIAGHGAVIVSLELAAADIVAGLLVHPFGPAISRDTYHIVATPENMARDDVQALCDWLIESVAAAPQAA